MKDDLDMMFSRIDKDIERISDKYPAAGRKEKERIYKLSQQKYQQLKAREEADEGFTVEASGVERYRRPMLYRGISAVAAALVLVSGLAGGLLLTKNSRIPKVDINDRNNTSQSTMVNEIDEDKMNADVDVLADNFEHIMRALYIPNDVSENMYDDLGVIFTKNDLMPTTGEMYSKELIYYKVKDEKLNAPEKLEEFMEASFTPKLKAYYFGGDLSGHENGEDFADDSMAARYVRRFIIYNGEVLADYIDDDMYFSYKFDEVYDFSNYKLVSSKFDDNIETFEGDLGLNDVFLQYDESDMQCVVCRRVYKREDDTLVNADFLLKKDGDNWKIANYSIMDENRKKLKESRKENEVQPTTAYGNDDNADFADVQLHEETLFSNIDEAIEFENGIREAMYNGEYKFKKVDIDKYENQIWNAKDNNEMNTLENKSYIYHLLINSYRYFDTADVSYTKNIDHVYGNAVSSVRCLADTRNRIFYLDSDFSDINDYPEHEEYHDHAKLYSYDNIWINANEDTKTFFQSEYEDYDYDNIYVPDNYCISKYYDENGEIIYNSTLTNIVFAGKCSECLFNHNVIGLDNFDDWYIEDVVKVLGRRCVSIRLENENGYISEIIDLRTGIILESLSIDENENTTVYMKVNSISIDTPLDYQYFDPTAYTDDSAVTE